MEDKIWDLAIIGSGPAGITAGIYAKRYMLDCMVIGPEVGGIAKDAHDIENWPGARGTGMAIMKSFEEHLLSFDVPIIREFTKSIKKEEDGLFHVGTDNETYKAKTIILAMGTQRRKLNIPGEEEFFGRGLSYCATCDCMFFKDKIVAVAGGGDSAAMAVQILTQHASKVYMVYRKSESEIKAEPARLKELKENPKVELILETNILEVLGDKGVTGLKLDNREEPLPVDGIFIEIGGIPTTALAQELGVELNSSNKIIVNEAMDTNIEGAYAAGDLTTGSNGFNQIITAGAEGSIAALAAFKYIKQKK